MERSVSRGNRAALRERKEKSCGKGKSAACKVLCVIILDISSNLIECVSCTKYKSLITFLDCIIHRVIEYFFCDYFCSSVLYTT